MTNHPNANINSANHPFRKHGTDAGGVWVTTEPTAFPVYGTTIGGKNGGAAARADALSTIKIEVPLPELPKMKAVQDPYGKNILRKGNDPRAIEEFDTWADIDVPTTVFLDDIKPQWLKNIGYVEEAPKLGETATFPDFVNVPSGWGIAPNDVFNNLRGLSKGDFKEYTGYTGHRHGMSGGDRAQRRFIDDYLDKNQPITERLPEFPKPEYIEGMARRQGATTGPKTVRDGIAEVPAPNEANRYSADFIPARKWTEDYRSYVKPGESIYNKYQFEFAPGAISRGIGGSNMPPIKDRVFNWNKYKQLIAEGESPSYAAARAKPEFILDWDNIIYHSGQYRPKVIDGDVRVSSDGHISAGTPRGRIVDLVTGEYLVNPNTQGAIHQYHQLTPEAIESLKNYTAYDDIVKDKDHPTWQELTRVLMRINAGTGTPYW